MTEFDYSFFSFLFLIAQGASFTGGFIAFVILMIWAIETTAESLKKWWKK